MKKSNSGVAYHPRFHGLALIASACTFFMILPTGALVTSTGSSLAVPDWPLSFGQFFPPMIGGVLFEHGHRLTVAAVSSLILAVFFTTLWVEDRLWVKVLSSSMVVALFTQAVLGGMTVRHLLPPALSVSHAGLAQITFCLTVSMAVVTSKEWMLERSERIVAVRGFSPTWAAFVTGLIYVQILLGAVTRHLGAGLAIPDFPLSFGQFLPPDWSSLITLQFSHTRVGAFLVLILVNLLSFRVCRRYTEEKALFLPAAAAALLVWVQCFLGILVIATSKMVVPTSVHVITGAALLASMLILTLNSFHLFKKGTSS